MKYRKFNKYEKKEIRSEMLANALHGEGLYLFENNTKADLTLPRPTRSGLRSVGPKGTPKAQFQGDNYYMQLVRQGHLRLIKVLQTPEQERALNQAEHTLNEATMTQENKLILDQPDTFKQTGKVEHVVSPAIPVQKLNEAGGQKQPDVLLNEGPDGFVIVGQ